MNRGFANDKAPLNNEVMDIMDLSDFDEISHLIEEAGQDIEYLLTLLDLKINKLSNEVERLESIKKDINSKIHSIFDIDELNAANSNKDLLDSFIQSIPNDSHIISLNYDCVLDQGLYSNKVWEPCCGYGIDAFPAQCNCETNADLKKIMLLKPHGSINFYSREIFNTNDKSEYPIIDANKDIFPNRPNCVSGREDNDGPYIATMSYDKRYKNGMFMFWRKAIKALKEADRLVVIGCSLRHEDAFLRYALYNFGARENVEKLFVEIVSRSKSSCKGIKDNVSKLVAHPDQCEFVTYPDGLIKFVS